MRLHIVKNKGEEHNYAIKLTFKTMNNEVDYEALFFGLMMAKSLGTKDRSTSRLPGSGQQYGENSWQRARN